MTDFNRNDSAAFLSNDSAHIPILGGSPYCHWIAPDHRISKECHCKRHTYDLQICTRLSRAMIQSETCVYT